MGALWCNNKLPLRALPSPPATQVLNPPKPSGALITPKMLRPMLYPTQPCGHKTLVPAPLPALARLC